MIDARKLGHADQVALAVVGDAVDVRVCGGIDVRLHPARGLDVGAAWFRGMPLAWIAPAGEGGGPGSDWRAAWGGGLVTTCGLDNVGAASEGIGLHGTYTFLRARDVEVERTMEEVLVRGVIDDPRGLRVRRTIRTVVDAGRLTVHDRTANVGARELEAPLLYHVNLGFPLWDEAARVSSDASEVVPRDEDAAAGPWREPGPPEPQPERVYEHVDATRAEVVNEPLGLAVAVESSLPRLWQWIDPTPGTYVLALEPANCSVLGRAHDRAAGRLPFLAPGEERETMVAISVELR